MRNGKGPGLVIAFGKGKPGAEGGDDSAESEAKEEAGKELASALGVTGEVDGAAVCDAVRTIMDLGYEEDMPEDDEEDEDE